MIYQWPLTVALVLTPALTSEDQVPGRPSSQWAMVQVSEPETRFLGVMAEIEVRHGGRVRRGRVVVEPGGRVHLEHLDPATTAWCRELLGRGDGRSEQRGWDTRLERAEAEQKPRRIWSRVGAYLLLTEVHATVGGEARRVRLLRHRVLGRGEP